MGDFGYRELSSGIGFGSDLSADGYPEMKIGGGTIDWSTVAALGADLDLGDGTIVKAGRKVLLPGQLMLGITRTGVAVVTLNNTPTGGTFTITVATTLPEPGATDTTTALAYNAAAATVQTALLALDNIGAGQVTVSGSAGGPYTLTFAQELGQVTVTGDGALLTGAGAQPTATVATTEEGGDTGKIGPYDTAVSDGRQTLTPPRTDCGLIRKPVIMRASDSEELRNDVHVGLIIGGAVVKSMVRATTGTHSLANGPTWAELAALLPRLVYVGGLRASHT